MADIGVFHDSLAAGGGAEAVGANAIAALLDDGHEVTLYTVSPVDIAAVNAYYGTTINPSELDVRLLNHQALRAMGHGIDAVSRLAGIEDMPLLRNAVADRVFRRVASEQDLLFSTQGELFASDAIQYIHFPYYSRAAMEQYGSRFDERLYPLYHRVCRAVKPRSEPPALTLTNSEWTADVIEQVYGVDTTVLYPPVQTEAFNPLPWGEREDGFVAVGRVHHLKRQAMLIEILDRLRERGIETHLHVVGSIGTGEYARRVEGLAADRSYISLEGTAPRPRLVELLETHKYGLHGRQFEHFGIAVAEMVAAGMVPFVPDSGGQVEVVGSAEYTYCGVNEAVEKVAAVVTSSPRQQNLRSGLSGAQYGIERFGRRLRTVVSEIV